MAELLDRLHTAAQGLTRVLHAAEAKAAWDAQSPCEGWTAADVAEHVINNYVSLAARVAEDIPRTNDRLQDWAHSRDAVFRAAAAKGALDRPIEGPEGDMPLGRLLAVYLELDTVVHTWDIARAVGADESLDEEVCRRCFQRMQPADKTMRSNGFGPKLPYAEDDPIQIKLLRYCGRPA